MKLDASVRPAKRWNSERRVQDHDGGLFPVAAEGWGALSSSVLAEASPDGPPHEVGDLPPMVG